MKMTEKQSKALQIICGIAGGLGIWYCIAFPTIYNLPPEQYQNSLIGWLWVIIFGAIMITQRQIEKKYSIRLTYFFRAYLVALVAGLVLFILYAVVNHISFFTK